ncbi:MAG TPA: TonB-dependent receptor, partial [Hyphomicrobiaceae bacterium]|nr:TonB-dependent receptor [Hyphomicrobiaceae bacterium]
YYFQGIGYRIRGFESEVLVDGFPLYYGGGDFSSLVNVERIEVLKGPGGIFYQGGQTLTGGVVNLLSKLPHGERRYEVGVVFGGHGTWIPWFDINQPLNASKTALFRMTAEFEQSREFIDVVERERYSLNPTFMFRDDASTLVIQLHASRRTQHEYSGLPAVGTIDRSSFSIRRDLFVGDPAIPKHVNANERIAAYFKHKLDDVWTIDVSARYGRSSLFEPTQALFNFFGSSNQPVFGSNFSVLSALLTETTHEMAFNANAIAKFQIADSRNTFLVGIDFNRTTDEGKLTGTFPYLVDFLNPTFPRYTFDQPLAFTIVDNTYWNSGLSIQLHSTIKDRFHILLGARLAHVDVISRELTTGGSFHTDEWKVLPRAGIVVDIVRGVSAFASYSEGLRAVPFFSAAAAPKPEESRQIEGGLKIALPTGLSATLALFEISRLNVATPDPNVPFAQVQTGEQQSRGFDIDLVWQPIAGLSVL